MNAMVVTMFLKVMTPNGTRMVDFISEGIGHRVRDDGELWFLETRDEITVEMVHFRPQDVICEMELDESDGKLKPISIGGMT